MQTYFYELADFITQQLQAQEIFTAYLVGENSDFCRLNQAMVRQAGHVDQATLSLRLIDGPSGAQKSATASLGLSFVQAADRESVRSLVLSLREQVKQLPADPYLFYATEVQSSESLQANRLPSSQAVISEVIDQAQEKALDLVGIYAAGKVFRGFTNSLGQRNWYENHSFNLDFSLYLRADKAVKSAYAGFTWQPAEFKRVLQRAHEQLAILAKPARSIKPGKYRAYLAPQAMHEIAGTLVWGGFGLKAQKTKSTCFLKMVEDRVRMDPRVSFWENTEGGVTPNFNEAGFIRPGRVVLIDQGEYRDCLISARSAKEYGVKTNGADGSESPYSLEMPAGDLDEQNVAALVGDGLYINNLWYLNFSDRPAGRITGMTRFASFLVENGRISAPLEVMRFDESVLKMFGEQLVGLTKAREFMLSASTYGQRSTQSMHLPGAVVDNLSFTL